MSMRSLACLGPVSIQAWVRPVVMSSVGSRCFGLLLNARVFQPQQNLLGRHLPGVNAVLALIPCKHSWPQPCRHRCASARRLPMLVASEMLSLH